MKLIAQMNSFQNCCLFFGFTKIWFFIIPLPCEEQQQQQLPSSCFDQWDDRWRCPANQVRLRLTIWFKHIKHLTISIYQDVFVQIGTVRTGKSDTDRDWWKWNVYFGHQEFSYCMLQCLDKLLKWTTDDESIDLLHQVLSYNNSVNYDVWLIGWVYFSLFFKYDFNLTNPLGFHAKFIIRRC